MKGRKPIPNDIKRAAGNPGRRPLNEHEPVYTVPGRVPYAPRHLNEVAQREWNRAARMLMQARVLTEADLVALELYCQAYGRWVEAEKKVAASGAVLKSAETGGLYQNPYLAIANKAHEQMMKLLPEFGMTPSSRTRIHALGEPKERSLAELLFVCATGKDAAVGDDDEDGADVEAPSDAKQV